MQAMGLDVIQLLVSKDSNYVYFRVYVSWSRDLVTWWLLIDNQQVANTVFVRSVFGCQGDICLHHNHVCCLLNTSIPRYLLSENEQRLISGDMFQDPTM